MITATDVKPAKQVTRLNPNFSESLTKEQAGRLTHALNILVNGFKCDADYAFKIPVDSYKDAHYRFFLLERVEIYKEKADILLSALKVLNAIDEEEYNRLLALFSLDDKKP